MTTKLVSTGDIKDIMQSDAFAIHGMMFNVREVIQCLFLCSKTMYTYFHKPTCNMFIIQISTEGSWIMGNPMCTNEQYIECVMRNDPSSNPQSEVQAKKNTYQQHGDKIILFCTKGFILDNFEVKDSYHDFRMNEKQTNVLIYATDIESLTVDNPDLE